MMWRTHIAAGALAGAAVAAFVPAMATTVILAALAGSILPDLDHPKSKLGRLIRPISDIIYLVFGHRGGTHSVIFTLLFMGIISLISVPIGIAFGAGILSHLAADAVSYSEGQRFSKGGAGIPAGWPFHDGKVGIRLVKVNGPLENMILMPAFLVLAIAVCAFTL